MPCRFSVLQGSSGHQHGMQRLAIACRSNDQVLLSFLSWLGQTYPYPPYVSGYYSNGPPYITYAAAMLDLLLEDYAIGEDHCHPAQQAS